MSEAHIRMLAKLYDTRDAARIILGERYASTMTKGATMIRAVMAKHNCGEMEAALKLGKEVSDNANSVMIIMASVVEMIEPTPSPTPKRQA